MVCGPIFKARKNLLRVPQPVMTGVEPALPAPASGFHSSAAATAQAPVGPGPSWNGAGREGCALPGALGTARPPRPPFCGREGKPCWRAASSVLLLPPPSAGAFVSWCPFLLPPQPSCPPLSAAVSLLFLPPGSQRLSPSPAPA